MKRKDESEKAFEQLAFLKGKEFKFYFQTFTMSGTISGAGNEFFVGKKAFQK